MNPKRPRRIERASLGFRPAFERAGRRTEGAKSGAQLQGRDENLNGVARGAAAAAEFRMSPYAFRTDLWEARRATAAPTWPFWFSSLCPHPGTMMVDIP